jgi:protein involved in polysaccharide export with SLBB domain
MKHAWIAVLLLLIAPATAMAQQAGPGPTQDTRQELETKRDSLTSLLQQMDVGDDRAPDIERRIADVEQRLRFGDFRPGDVVGLIVRGQEDWTGSFPVQPDQTIVLPALQPIPLAGVLHSEAEEVIRGALATVLRNPLVELATQMRISVTGQVGQPGFYDVSGTLLLSDVIMLAGGPTQRSKLESVEIRRLAQTIMSGAELTSRGATLDELGVQSGDVVYIPEDKGGLHTLRTFSVVVGSIASIFFLINRIGN